MGQSKNLAQQRMLNASQLANDFHLGTPIGEYPQTRKPEIIRTLRAFGMFLLGFLLAFLSLPQPAPLGPLGAIGGAVLVALGLTYLLEGCFYLIAKRMYAFTDGFIYFKRGKPVVLRWEDVRFIRKVIRRHGPFYGSITLIVTSYIAITLTNGQVVIFRIRDIEPFNSLLHARVAAVGKAKMMKAYEAGAVLTFGPLGLSLAGVSYQKKLLPWSDIDQIFLSLGTLQIWEVKEKQSNWATIREAEHIPKIALFIEMTRDILKAKRSLL